MLSLLLPIPFQNMHVRKIRSMLKSVELSILKLSHLWQKKIPMVSHLCSCKIAIFRQKLEIQILFRWNIHWNRLSFPSLISRFAHKSFSISVKQNIKIFFETSTTLKEKTKHYLSMEEEILLHRLKIFWYAHFCG